MKTEDINFDRLYAEGAMVKRSWKYEKLSVRLDEAFYKLNDLYTWKRYLCYPFLYLSWITKHLYILLKKFAACFGIFYEAMAELSDDDLIVVKSHKKYDIVREKNEVEKCCDCVLTTASGAAFAGVAISTALMWFLSNLFLILSFTWCLKTDIRYESDYYFKMMALREKLYHYDMKISNGEENPQEWKDRQAEKRENVKVKIDKFIEDKEKDDLDRFGVVSPQTLGDKRDPYEKHKLPHLLRHFLITTQVKVTQMIKSEAINNEVVQKMKLKAMEENPSATGEEITKMVEETYHDVRMDELSDQRTSMMIQLSRKFLSAKKTGAKTDAFLTKLIDDKVDYDSLMNILSDVEPLDTLDYKELHDSCAFFSASVTDESLRDECLV